MGVCACACVYLFVFVCCMANSAFESAVIYNDYGKQHFTHFIMVTSAIVIIRLNGRTWENAIRISCELKIYYQSKCSHKWQTVCNSENGLRNVVVCMYTKYRKDCRERERARKKPEKLATLPSRINIIK